MSEQGFIGTCPVCGKGHVIATSHGYACDFDGDGESGKCEFFLFNEVNGAYLDEATVRQLITTGKTELLEFQSKEGKKYKARLTINDGKLERVYEDVILKGVCPKCGGKVKETSFGYVCEHRREKQCTFIIPKDIRGRNISVKEAEDFLAGKHVVLDGFTSKEGREYSSMLATKDNGYVDVNSIVARCPKCGGEVRVNAKSYSCRNHSNPDVQCDFHVWREMAGHAITPDEVVALCKDGATAPIKFKKRDGSPFTCRLVLDANKVVDYEKTQDDKNIKKR